jgi:hypothetical protein
VHQTHALVTRPANTRSRITNRSEMLRGIDGRSAESRRYRDLVEGFVADFGSQPQASARWRSSARLRL